MNKEQIISEIDIEIENLLNLEENRLIISSNEDIIESRINHIGKMKNFLDIISIKYKEILIRNNVVFDNEEEEKEFRDFVQHKVISVFRSLL